MDFVLWYFISGVAVATVLEDSCPATSLRLQSFVAVVILWPVTVLTSAYDIFDR